MDYKMEKNKYKMMFLPLNSKYKVCALKLACIRVPCTQY